MTVWFWIVMGGGMASALIALTIVWVVRDWLAPFTAWFALAFALWLLGIEIANGSI